MVQRQLFRVRLQDDAHAAGLELVQHIGLQDLLVLVMRTIYCSLQIHNGKQFIIIYTGSIVTVM